jgi:hypothetical protein
VAFIGDEIANRAPAALLSRHHDKQHCDRSWVPRSCSIKA